MKKLVSIILALVLVSVMSVSAFAAASVVAPIEKEYNGGTATITQDVKNPSQLTFEVVEKDGYKFVGWDIEGDYEIIKGDSLSSNPITIIFKDGTILENVVAKPLFEKVDDDEPTTKPNDEKPNDEKPVSPGTGDSMVMLTLAVAALGGVVVSKKRLSK